MDTIGGRVWVVNRPPASGPAPTHVGQEELRVGTMEGGGPTSFGLIRSIAVLPDGRFAISDSQAEEVRVFDRDGRHLRTFGGDGAGPGELSGMQGAYVDQDGLLRVAEQGNARLSVFHPDTGFVTSVPFRLFSYGVRGPWAATIDSTGATRVASSGQYGEGRFWNMLRIYDSSMTQVDSIPYYDYTDDAEREMPGAWRVSLANGFTWAPVPFYSRRYEALAPTGDFWSSAEGEAQLEIVRWRPPGDTSFVLVSGRVPPPVTTAERDSAMAELRERLAQQVSGPPSLEPSRVPSTKPPVYGLSLDDRGRLWARVTEPSADTTVYDIFHDDGGFAETLFLPFGVDAWIPPVVSGATLWAVVTDQLDVQYAVRASVGPAPEGDG